MTEAAPFHGFNDPVSQTIGQIAEQALLAMEAISARQQRFIVLAQFGGHDRSHQPAPLSWADGAEGRLSDLGPGGRSGPRRDVGTLWFMQDLFPLVGITQQRAFKACYRLIAQKRLHADLDNVIWEHSRIWVSA